MLAKEGRQGMATNGKQGREVEGELKLLDGDQAQGGPFAPWGPEEGMGLVGNE